MYYQSLKIDTLLNVYTAHSSVHSADCTIVLVLERCVRETWQLKGSISQFTALSQLILAVHQIVAYCISCACEQSLAMAIQLVYSVQLPIDGGSVGTFKPGSQYDTALITETECRAFRNTRVVCSYAICYFICQGLLLWPADFLCTTLPWQPLLQSKLSP